MFTVILPYFFFFNDTATTDIYTLSLHDALPIWRTPDCCAFRLRVELSTHLVGLHQDRKSTRLNSSHVEISYAVFCLKKKKKTKKIKYTKKKKTTKRTII